MKFILLVFFSFLLSGCLTVPSQPVDNESSDSKDKILTDYISNREWVSAYEYIENAYILGGDKRIEKALPYFSLYPDELQKYGGYYYEKNCNNQSESLGKRRIDALTTLNDLGVKQAEFLRDKVITCESIKIEQAEKLRLEKIKKEEDEALRAAKKEKDEALRIAKIFHDWSVAKKNAEISCSAANCDDLFLRSQIFVSENSDMKIQVSTSAVVETYYPNDIGKIGMKVYKIPTGANNGKLQLKLICKHIERNVKQREVCMEIETAIYNEFNRYMLDYK